MTKLKLYFQSMCCEQKVKDIFLKLHGIIGVEAVWPNFANQSMLVQLQPAAIPAVRVSFPNVKIFGR